MSRELHHARDKWGRAGIEPRLEDVLADPIVHLVMQRDRVGLPELRAHVAAVQRHLRSRLCYGLAA